MQAPIGQKRLFNFFHKRKRKRSDRKHKRDRLYSDAIVAHELDDDHHDRGEHAHDDHNHDDGENDADASYPFAKSRP